MFKDLLELLKEVLGKFFTSRIFALAIIFTCMFGILISKLFNLQILEGENYLADYIQKTKRTVMTASTRGNIYDRNGKVLAYNELAYIVTIQDTGAYPKNADRNAMLLRLVNILNEHNETVDGKLEIAINSSGEMVYTSSSETARKRFLRDFYGLKNVDELDDLRGRYPSNVTARELFEQKKKSYELDKMKDDDGNPLEVSDEDALKIINIRYTMSFTAYQKYETTTVSSYVSEETVADILEHKSSIEGVDVEESTIRIYNDSVCFAPIIGYTGKAPEDQLRELQNQNGDYEMNDIVGRTGIESAMELELQGQKGSRTMYVDNMGRILEITEEVESKAGNDVYLSIDRDLQVGIYNLIEQQLAGVLASKIVDYDVDISKINDASKFLIPVKDAYFQLINNNVLSLDRIASEDASDIEKQINSKYLQSKEQVFANMRSELMSPHAVNMNELPQDMMSYMVYFYNYMVNSGIVIRENQDTSSEEYLAWRADTISLRDFIYSGIENNWIDTTKLKIESRYSSADDTFQVLVDDILERLNDDNLFTKRIYRYLINNDVVTGRELCLALYEQGVLARDEAGIRALTANGEAYAYTFIIDKISNIEITPAQLALDPCTGGCVVTNDKTGEVLALVTYPSYDNNRLSGTVDSEYYSQLQADLSLPLYNNATQAQKAPGSTFKPITAVAGLEEQVIGLTEHITCTGRYDEVDPPIRCWISPGAHGSLDVVGGIQNSCNYFVSEVAHRLSMDENGNYRADKGIEALRKYASMFGLDEPSGVEISEYDPKLTTEDPERSAMGQGTNSYSNIQLSRYVTALANRGTVYQLSVLDKLTDSAGNLIEDYTPEVRSQIDIADSTWDAVQLGMRRVISDGSARNIFRDLNVEVAGKTGTAQESKTRTNHAFFISFAPFSDPEVCVTVNIPYGYSSSNAVALGKNVYSLYYGYTDLDSILRNGALDVANVSIGD